MSVTTTSLTGNFAGTKAQGYLYPAILAANTIGDSLVTVHENIDYKLNIRNLATTGFLAAATCDFQATGNVNLSDVVLEPTELQINVELCKKDFRTQWEKVEMQGALLGQDIPSSFQDFFILKNTELLSKDIEVAIWQGGSFTGLESRLAGDAGVIDVSNLGTPLSASNIIDELQKLYNAVPNEVFVADDFAFILPISAQKFYITAQAALGYNNLYYDGKTPLNFLGVPIKVANGLSNDKMVAARASDLHVGTNVLTDVSNIQVVDMSETDGSQNVRYIARLSFGTQITNGANIVYYVA